MSIANYSEQLHVNIFLHEEYLQRVLGTEEFHVVRSVHPAHDPLPLVDGRGVRNFVGRDGMAPVDGIKQVQ